MSHLQGRIVGLNEKLDKLKNAVFIKTNNIENELDDLSTFVDSLPDPEHRKKLSISIRNIKSISDYLSGYSECV